MPADQLETLKAIKVLYFIQNKISQINGLDGVADTLESVEFGGNKLRVSEALSVYALNNAHTALLHNFN